MKTVLVTGATGGIGEAIARAFAREKYRVIMHYHSQEEKAKAIEAALIKEGFDVITLNASLTEAKSIDAMLAKLNARGVKVDVLINNAGIKDDSPITAMDDDVFKRVMDVNVNGPWMLMKRVIPSMKARGFGRIINITSGVAKEGRKNQTNYAASKAALENLTRSLAQECGAYGITVNAVAPGLIETPMTENVSQEVKASYIERVPLGRLVKPDDVAHACLFFASDASGAISSQILGVNGGIR